ncbi:MAG TPA: COX15/CtaA family protein [Chitinophagaceae bacterium]|nr:COX15/CtaA family protein [Chitinophagaceae bacterium]
MEDQQVSRRTKPVAIWLLTGVAMIMVQVVLGGITRLTGSGLSITQWDPIIGIIPPLNHHDWMVAFQSYRLTPQFRLHNPDYTLGEFKAIFFWEYLHRLWARLIGVVFIVPFIIFLVTKRFNRAMARPMVLLFILGGLQGLIGWIMVESGLAGENIRVSHIRLAAHFFMAMVLLGYTFWFALKLIVNGKHRVYSPSLRWLTGTILGLLCLQLIYGAFMAGLHAALYAPTWPSINGAAIPAHLFRNAKAWISDPLTVQFIHRGLAYLITLLVISWTMLSRRAWSPELSRTRWLPLIMVIIQVLLGIATVSLSKVRIPVLLALSHQTVAMLLLTVMIYMFYLASAAPPKSTAF